MLSLTKHSQVIKCLISTWTCMRTVTFSALLSHWGSNLQHAQILVVMLGQ